MDTLFSREAREEARSRNKREEARLCATCRWYQRSRHDWTDDHCAYPLMPYIVKQKVMGELIRGEIPPVSLLCSTARSFDNECGSEGKYWEDADD